MIKKLLSILCFLPLLGEAQPNFFWDQLHRLPAPTNAYDTLLIGTTNNLYLINSADFVTWMNSSLTNLLVDSVYIDAAKFGVSSIYIQTNDAANLAAVQAFPNQDLALSNCLAYARSIKGKTTVRLPLGIVPITNEVWLMGCRANLIGYGTCHSGGFGHSLCLTNYSMLWQKNTNASGLTVMMDAAAITLANLEICGSTNPIADLNTPAYWTAPIWSPREGITNASPFAKVGINARGLTTQYCGGMSTYNISIVGFRIGVVNWGNDELWYQPQLVADDIGWVNPGHSIFGAMQNTNPPDLPINMNGYMTLISTNPMPPDAGYGGSSFGWALGVPDQITFLHPSFGWRQGGLAYMAARGNGNKIQQSCGIFGPRTFALLTEAAPFDLECGNDEPDSFIGTNWIYSQFTPSRISIKNWNINGFTLGGTTNASGDDLRAFSLVYSPDTSISYFDFDGSVPITGLDPTNVFNAVCCPNGGGNMGVDWRFHNTYGDSFQFYNGQYGGIIAWPATSPGPNFVAGVNLQYEMNGSNSFYGWWTHDAFGNPNGSNVPYGQLGIEKSTNGDYPFMTLSSGNIHPGTNALARLMSSRPAGPLETGTYGYIPRLYDADAIGTGGTGFTPQSSKPVPSILPGGGLYMWNSNNLWLMASYTSGQGWGPENLIASFPFHATNVPNLAMVMDVTITNPVNMTTAITLQDTWGGHSLVDQGGNFGTAGHHSWFTNNGIGTGTIFAGNEYCYFTNCWFNNGFSPEWVQPTTYFIVCTIGSAGNIDFIDNNGAVGDRQQIQSANGLNAGISCGSGTTFPVRTNIPIILECVFNAGQSYVRTNLAYSLTPGSFPFIVGGGQAGLSVGNNGAGSQYNYGNIAYMLVYTNRLLKGWEETNIINWLNYSNRLTTGGPTNGGFHCF